MASKIVVIEKQQPDCLQFCSVSKSGIGDIRVAISEVEKHSIFLRIIEKFAKIPCYSLKHCLFVCLLFFFQRLTK